MFIFEIFEDAGKRLVVTYPGRFQPFHQGHADVFASLQARYGSDNVFIVTGNKTDGAKSPFNFSDKVKLMHAAGIPDHSIIEASQVYDLPDRFKPEASNISFIVAVGAPDSQRLNPGSVKKDGHPSYFQKVPNEGLKAMTPADQHGYVVIADERQKVITIGGKQVDVSHGTPCRALWNDIRNKPEQRAEFLKQLYGSADPALGHILDKIPTGAPEPTPKPSPKLKKVKSPVPTPVEEAAGVGVVKGGKDPRYYTATMGDQNDVNADTLNKEMRGYGLIGRKVPKKVKEGMARRISELSEELEVARSELAKYRKDTIQEMSAGGTGAGGVATSMGNGNGFGWSIFYQKQQQNKKAKKK
jgi:hypothetical protein